MPPGNTRRPFLRGRRPGGPVLRKPEAHSQVMPPACGHTVRSQFHGPNAMIIGWPDVPVLRASRACPSQCCVTVTGFRVASWCHGVAERSGPGFKSSRWFMFSRLKGLGTSSSHAGGTSLEAVAAAAVTIAFSLTSPGPADSTSQHRDAKRPTSLIQ